MQAFHGDQAVKDKYLERIRQHRAADEIIQGTGWDGRKGCAVGCTFERYDHNRGPIEIGVPAELMHLEDAIFEGLPVELAKDWPEQFLASIPVGADLSMVWPRLSLWILSDPANGVLRFANNTVRPAIEEVTSLYREWCETGVKPDLDRFDKARAGAARGAARAAARGAARGAAGEAGWAAREAAREAREAREDSYWLALRDEMLTLLASAPQVTNGHDTPAT